MTRLEKIILLITFYLSPISQEKHDTWNTLVGVPMDEENLMTVIAWIVGGDDDLSWDSLEDFKDATLADLK